MYNCVCSRLKEVNGFYDYDEYTMIYGGRWFCCCECGKIWRLIPPDYPFKGLWEPVVAAQ